MTGNIKKKLKRDLASKVLADIWPSIEATQRQDDAEREELEQAEREYNKRIRSSSLQDNDGAAAAAAEDAPATDVRKALISVRLAKALTLRVTYDTTAQGDGQSTPFVVTASISGSVFEGQGRTALLARTVATAEALRQLFNATFEYDDNGFPLYVGTAAELSALKVDAGEYIKQNFSAASVSTNKPAPLNLTIEGKPPAAILNEFYNGNLIFEDIERAPRDDGGQDYCVRVEVEGKKFVGRGDTSKYAKQDAALMALKELKSSGQLARRVSKREAVSLKKNLTVGTRVWKNPYKWVYDEEPIPVKTGEEDEHRLDSLAKFNQLHPGSKFEMISGSVDGSNPSYTFTLTVDGQTFQGSGHGKRPAKCEAAELALRAFEQWTAEDDKVKEQYIAEQNRRFEIINSWQRGTWPVLERDQSSGSIRRATRGGRTNRSFKGYGELEQLAAGGQGVGRRTTSVMVALGNPQLSQSLSYGAGQGPARVYKSKNRGAGLLGPGGGRLNRGASAIYGSNFSGHAGYGYGRQGQRGGYQDYSDYSTNVEYNAYDDPYYEYPDAGYGQYYGSMSADYPQGPSLLGRGIGAVRGASARGSLSQRGLGSSAADVTSCLPAAQPGMCTVTTCVETVSPDGTITRRIERKECSIEEAGLDKADSRSVTAKPRDDSARSKPAAHMYSNDDFDFTHNDGTYQSFDSANATKGNYAGGADRYSSQWY